MSLFNRKFNAVLIALALTLTLPAASYADSSTPAQQRAAIDKMESNALARLYKANPQAKTEIANSVGYAVFSSGSLAVIWVSAGYGHGVAHNLTRHTKTYMEMANAGVGLGLGAKVFIFNNKKVYHDFIKTGLDLTGSADAAAKEKNNGGAASGSADVLRGVKIYQLTDTGLLAQLMLQGTKYWPDRTLTSNKN